MVLKESKFLLKIGEAAPQFELLEPKTGKSVSSKDATLENGLLVAFICNHCPYVKWIAEELGKLGTSLSQEYNIGMVGISSTDYAAYAEDSPDMMKVIANREFASFPYLLDEDQSVAKAYGANCTPDFFLLDKEGKVFYRGRLDESRPHSTTPVTGEDIRNAAALLAAGAEPPPGQRVSMGCSIKWKPGNEPDY